MQVISSCKFCGHSKMKYKHKLNVGLVKALLQMYRANRPVNFQRDLNLTKNQYNNLQKLQYFNLIKKIENSSLWEITIKGRLFCENEIPVHVFATTIEGNPVENEDKTMVKLSDYKEKLGPDYWTIKDYINN